MPSRTGTNLIPDSLRHCFSIRKLWSIFVGEAIDDKNPESIEIRQNIANIGIFVMTQSAALAIKPEVERMQALIDINRNIATGLNGRV